MVSKHLSFSPYDLTILTVCVCSWRRVQFGSVGRCRAFYILLSSERSGGDIVRTLLSSSPCRFYHYKRPHMNSDICFATYSSPELHSIFINY